MNLFVNAPYYLNNKDADLVYRTFEANKMLGILDGSIKNKGIARKSTFKAIIVIKPHLHDTINSQRSTPIKVSTWLNEHNGPKPKSLNKSKGMFHLSKSDPDNYDQGQQTSPKFRITSKQSPSLLKSQKKTLEQLRLQKWLQKVTITSNELRKQYYRPGWSITRKATELNKEIISSILY